jgi:5-methylcytosine-specific restriction endonuclease McrA
MNQSKTCSKCRKLTPLENFRIDRSAKDGRQSACKPCQKNYYQANAETIKAKSKKYRADNIDKVREQQRVYHLNNAEKKKATARKWYADNLQRARELRRRTYDRDPERWINKTAEWKKANRSRANQSDLNSAHTRRARINSGKSFDISLGEMTKLRSQNCVYCGEKNSIELDHVIPLSRGGSHSIGNLVAACRTCNASKGSKTIMEWRKRKSPRA